MTVIECARELGRLIQADERYTGYIAAANANDKDKDLQRLMGEFNAKRFELNQEMQKQDKDGEKMTALDDEIRELYQQIMTNKSMEHFNDSKEAFDSLLSSVSYIITRSANGEDPDTIPETPPVSSCSGSCASCGGCG